MKNPNGYGTIKKLSGSRRQQSVESQYTNYWHSINRVDLAHRAHSLTPYQYQDSLLGAPQQGCLREIMTVIGET